MLVTASPGLVLAITHMAMKNVPRMIRPTFDCFLKNATRSCTGRTFFSCMSATSHAMVDAHARERRKAVQSLESECKV